MQADLQGVPAPSGHQGCLQPCATDSLFPGSWGWLTGRNTCVASQPPLFPRGLRRGRDSSLAHFGHPAGFWAWGYLLEATPECRVREISVRKSLGEPLEGYAGPTDCVRGAAWSEGPVAGGAEHLLLLHISEFQMVSPVCQSQLWTDCFLEVLISRKPWRARLLSS